MFKKNICQQVNVALLAGLLAGCAASSARLNKLSLGMPREAAIKTLGKPHSVSAQGDTEYLTYNLIVKRMGERRAYNVRLVRGEVEAFGEAADFGPSKFASAPTNPPSIKVTAETKN